MYTKTIITFNRKSVTTILGTLLLFTAILSCSKSNTQNGNITITDTQGNTLSLEKPAQRAVVLYEPLLEAIYMLGTEKKLVGIPTKTYTDKDNYTAFSLLDDRIAKKEIQTPGDMEAINIESIVALNPDIVIAYQLSPNVISSLQKMGIAVYMGKSETYNDIKQEIKDLAKIFNVEKRGKELLDFAQKEFDNIAKKKQNKNTKKAYFSWANGRIFTTTGQTSMMHECLQLAGVENVCTTNTNQVNINAETLATWNPDVIFMWNDNPKLFYDNKQLKAVTAIKEKNIYTLMPMFYYNPHTLKALLTVLKMQTWVYNTHTEEEIKTKSKEYLTTLYGEKIGTKLYNTLYK